VQVAIRFRLDVDALGAEWMWSYQGITIYVAEMKIALQDYAIT
jgi:hypothetical protein